MAAVLGVCQHKALSFLLLLGPPVRLSRPLSHLQFLPQAVAMVEVCPLLSLLQPWVPRLLLSPLQSPLTQVLPFWLVLSRPVSPFHPPPLPLVVGLWVGWEAQVKVVALSPPFHPLPVEGKQQQQLRLPFPLSVILQVCQGAPLRHPHLHFNSLSV